MALNPFFLQGSPTEQKLVQELIDEEGISSLQQEQDDDGNAITFNQSDMMLRNKFSLNAPFTVFKYVVINPNINFKPRN